MEESSGIAWIPLVFALAGGVIIGFAIRAGLAFWGWNAGKQYSRVGTKLQWVEVRFGYLTMVLSFVGILLASSIAYFTLDLFPAIVFAAGAFLLFVFPFPAHAIFFMFHIFKIKPKSTPATSSMPKEVASSAHSSSRESVHESEFS